MSVGADPPSRSAPSVGPTAAALVGTAVALSVVTVPDALLVPALDRAPPRAIGLLGAGLALALGWLAVGRAPLRTRPVTLVIAVAALLGGFLSAALLEPLAASLDEALRTGGLLGLGYHPTVLLVALALETPLLAPLGALLAIVVDASDRRAAGWTFLGVAAGLLLAPYLGEVLLGRRVTLQTCAVLAGAAGWLVTETAPHRSAPRGASLRRLVTLTVIAAGATLTWRLTDLVTDRGGMGLPLFTTLLALAAALGARLVPSRWAAPLTAAAAWASAGLLPSHPSVLPFGGTTLTDDVLRLAVVAGPWGLALGAALGPHDDDASARWTGALRPVVLAFGVPLALMIGLALAAPSALLIGLGAVAWGCTPRRAVAIVPAALALLLLPTWDVGPGAAPDDVHHLPDVTVATFADPVTDRTRLVVGGRAAVARSARQERRFVHVPMLMHGGGHERVLVIGSTSGEELRAVRMHDVLPPDATSHQPPFVWWLSPVGFPPGWRPEPADAPEVFLEFGSERQFLAEHAEGYDVIVQSPDPRVRRRAHLLGTRSYYALARSRLTDGGVFCQWWDLAASDVTDVKAAIASMHREFPAVTLVHDHPRTRHGVVGLIGTERPLRLDPRAIDAWVAGHPDVAADLVALDLDGLAVACLASADRAMLELLAPPEDAITDDRPVIAVRAGWRTLAQPSTLAIGMRTWSARRQDPRDVLDLPDTSPEEAARFDAVARDIQRAWAHLFGHAIEIVETYGTTVRPFDTEAPGELFDEEIPGFHQALPSLPEWPLLTREIIAWSRRVEREGRVHDADRALRIAISRDELNAELRVATAELAERRGDLADARVLFTSALECDADHAAALEGLLRVGGTWPPEDD